MGEFGWVGDDDKGQITIANGKTNENYQKPVKMKIPDIKFSVVIHSLHDDSIDLINFIKTEPAGQFSWKKKPAKKTQSPPIYHNNKYLFVYNNEYNRQMGIKYLCFINNCKIFLGHFVKF